VLFKELLEDVLELKDEPELTLRALATAAAMEGWREETTEEVSSVAVRPEVGENSEDPTFVLLEELVAPWLKDVEPAAPVAPWVVKEALLPSS
jgi:hypothetical protein